MGNLFAYLGFQTKFKTVGLAHLAHLNVRRIISTNPTINLFLNSLHTYVPYLLNLISEKQSKWEISSNVCGLLRKLELY